jgi:formiminotetrahydrofolate cyclodeaminase
MIYERNTPIEQFLAATALRQPTPGGGSVAALAGALAAAIGEMALNYSIGRKDGAAIDVQLKPAVAELERARELLLHLMVEDQAAYEALSAILKLPTNSADRADRLPATILTCIRVPQAVGGTGVAILEQCDQVLDLVNPRLLSDLAVCAELAMATVRTAMYNCRVNLELVTDSADRQSIEATMSEILAHALALIQRIMPRLWARLEKK